MSGIGLAPAWIYEHFAQLGRCETMTSAYCTALTGLDAWAALRSSLSEGRANAVYVTDACHRSYKHPNGFIKLELARSQLWVLRLHVWFAAVPIERNDLHDHRGFFVSHIMQGCIKNEEFAPCGTDGLTRYLKYRDSLVDSVHRLTEAGEQTLALHESITYTKGVTYLLGRDIIHRTTPQLPFPTVTLVLEGPHVSDFSTVYRLQRRPDSQVVRVRCTPELFLNTIEVVVSGDR